MEEMITIKKSSYDALVLNSRHLRALESAGVDNWEGYSTCMGELYEDDEDEDE